MQHSIKTTVFGLAMVCGSALWANAALADDAAILTDSQGMTLYTFDKDKKGKSVCYDGCAAKWPPYIASDFDKGKWGFQVIIRKDGTKQWAYKNKPLYTWVGDSAKGDTTGDGVGGVWHTAKRQAAYSSSNYKNDSSGGSNY